jgi:hypothetical protein
MASYKFTASLPSDPEFRLNEREMMLWDKLQTNSRRALFRFARFGVQTLNNKPRYDLHDRLMRDLGWTWRDVDEVWHSMREKCWKARRKAMGYQDYRRRSPFIKAPYTKSY